MNVDYFQMQHFITESNWDAKAMMYQIEAHIVSLLPRRKMTGLIIDETGWVKKGDKSVGVGWQCTCQGIAYKHAQRIFVGHCIKESKPILGTRPISNPQMDGLAASGSHELPGIIVYIEREVVELQSSAITVNKG